MVPGWDGTKKREGGPKGQLWQPHAVTPTLPRPLAAGWDQVILHVNEQSLGSG